MNPTTSPTALTVAALALGAPAFAGEYAINEIYASMSGSDTEEFVELIGTPGASLDGFLICIVEGDAGSAFGTLDRAYDLTGLSMPADGFFLAGTATVPGIDFDLGNPQDNLENGTNTYYLIEEAVPGSIALLLGTDVDPEDDGTTVLPTLGTVHDLIAPIDSLSDVVFDNAATVGPDGTFYPAGIFRDLDYPNSWCSQSFLDFDPFANVAEPRTPGATNSPCAALETVSYCTAGTSAAGCEAVLWSAGVPSATAASGFYLTAGCVEGQKDGLFFFGVNGRQANAWGNGTSYQCVVPPVRRAGLLTGNGTTGACDGYFNQDLNTRWTAKPAQNPGSGAAVQAQLWYRDPMNTSNQTTSLSGAVEFTVLP
jgi:hypothetical protein